MNLRNAVLTITFPDSATEEDRRKVEAGLTDIATQIGYPATLMIDSWVDIRPPKAAPAAS